jgi:hypothetical protein
MPPQPRLRPNTSRSPNASLKLPSLPRFHPANFPSSQHSSAGNTPGTGVTSPQGPLSSPRPHSRQHSDLQRQLHAYQRGLIASAMRTSPATSPRAAAKPDSPRLEPLGSPGPVTPLMLEEQGGYLVAGSRSSGKPEAAQDELVEKFIQDEARRRVETTPPQRTSPPVGGR